MINPRLHTNLELANYRISISDAAPILIHLNSADYQTTLLLNVEEAQELHTLLQHAIVEARARSTVHTPTT